MPALSDEVIEAIRERVPAYRRPLRGRFGAALRRGVEEALGQFADLVADPELDRSGAERVYRELGRGEHRERRSLDALLAAYRLGARVSWRRVSAIAIEAGVDRRTLALLAEAVFAYIDELSALSAEGYARGAVGGRRRERAARGGGSPQLLLDPTRRARRGRGARPRRRVGSCRRSRRARLGAAAGAACARGCRRGALVAEERATAAGIALLADPDAPGARARGSSGPRAQAPAVLGPTVDRSSGRAQRRARARACSS